MEVRRLRNLVTGQPPKIAGAVLVDPTHPSQNDLKRCDPACLPAALLDDEARM